LWYNDNFVGTELNVGVEYAKVAEACGVKGVKAENMEDLTNALNTAVKEQMEDNLTTFIEVVLNQELGEPFRRDAMKAPVAVAGIDAKDMRSQQGG
jgi:sulfoacetaldehyde acetyltransferase